MIGRVTSAKSLKTATVLLERTKRHPLYRKDFASSKKYLVDVPMPIKVGDIVEFVKCRPVSKRKHWKVTKVLGQDFVALGEKQLKEHAEQAIAEILPEEVDKPSDDSLQQSDKKTKKDKKQKEESES